MLYNSILNSRPLGLGNYRLAQHDRTVDHVSQSLSSGAAFKKWGTNAPAFACNSSIHADGTQTSTTLITDTETTTPPPRCIRLSSAVQRGTHALQGQMAKVASAETHTPQNAALSTKELMQHSTSSISGTAQDAKSSAVSYEGDPTDTPPHTENYSPSKAQHCSSTCTCCASGTTKNTRRSFTVKQGSPRECQI